MLSLIDQVITAQLGTLAEHCCRLRVDFVAGEGHLEVVQGGVDVFVRGGSNVLRAEVSIVAVWS